MSDERPWCACCAGYDTVIHSPDCPDVVINPWAMPVDHPDAAGKDAPHSMRLAFGEVWQAGFDAAAASTEEP